MKFERRLTNKNLKIFQRIEKYFYSVKIALEINYLNLTPRLSRLDIRAN